MRRNKKNGKRHKNIGLIAAAALCYVLGIGSIVAAAAGEKWEVSGSWQILLSVVGIAAMLLFTFFVYRYLTCFIDSHEDWKVEEEDERNEMIRGKAAIQCSFIMSFLSLAALLILIVCKQWLAVTLLCVMDCIENCLRSFLFGYYDKRY